MELTAFAFCWRCKYRIWTACSSWHKHVPQRWGKTIVRQVDLSVATCIRHVVSHMKCTNQVILNKLAPNYVFHITYAVNKMQSESIQSWNDDVCLRATTRSSRTRFFPNPPGIRFLFWNYQCIMLSPAYSSHFPSDKPMLVASYWKSCLKSYENRCLWPPKWGRF